MDPCDPELRKKHKGITIEIGRKQFTGMHHVWTEQLIFQMFQWMNNVVSPDRATQNMNERLIFAVVPWQERMIIVKSL